MDDYYDLFQEIRRRKIDSRQVTKDFGRQAAFRLNSKCPVVIKRGGVPLDVLAADMGFESDEALYEAILNYFPKYKWEREVKEHERCLGHCKGISRTEWIRRSLQCRFSMWLPF